MLNALKKNVEKLRNQNGPGRSTTDLIFTRSRSSRKLESMAKISLHALSIFKKVYDRVSRDKLWRVLREHGVDGHFWSVATRH